MVETEGNNTSIYGLIKVKSLIRRINLNQDGWPDLKARNSPLYLNLTLFNPI